MTTTYQIIVDAYRQSNLTALGVPPTQLQESEGLRYLNRLVKSVFGNEAGEQLEEFPIGRNNISRPSGFPWYDPTPGFDFYVPKNKRLMLNLTAPLTIYLDPLPDDGSRFSVVDVSNNLATNNLTIQGNGRTIQGLNSIVLNTNSSDASWFYRADIGDWVKYEPLDMFDTFPFPEEFDDYFILLLAFRLNPAYERTLDPQSKVMLDRSKQQFSARYSQHIFARSELGLTRPSKTDQTRYEYQNNWYYSDPVSQFNRGYPW